MYREVGWTVASFHKHDKTELRCQSVFHSFCHVPHTSREYRDLLGICLLAILMGSTKGWHTTRLLIIAIILCTTLYT